MKKILVGLSGLMVLALVFGTGVYAANNWLDFTGDEQIKQSNNDVDEIMGIMAQLNSKNITLEEAVERLEAMNPSGLAKENKNLRDQVAQLNTDLVAKQKEIEGKQAEINEKNQAYDTLQQERDQIATARDNAITERDNLQAKYDTLDNSYTTTQEELTQANEHVKHLEAELQQANEAVANHAQNTSEAVEQARTYKE